MKFRNDLLTAFAVVAVLSSSLAIPASDFPVCAVPADPTVTAIVERWMPPALAQEGIVIDVYGTKLRKARAVGLNDEVGFPLQAPVLLEQSNEHLALRLPASVGTGSYELVLTLSRSVNMTTPFQISGYALSAPLTVGASVLGATDLVVGANSRIASGKVAIGNLALATGSNCIAVGETARAESFNTAAFCGGKAVGAFTFAAIGTATGEGSLAHGAFSESRGKDSHALGFFVVAQPYLCTSLGRFNAFNSNWDPLNWVPTEPIFQVGNGPDLQNRGDCLTLYKNGNLTIAGTLTQLSDARLKQDIEPVTGILEKLRGMPVVSYTFRDTSRHPAGRQIGILAQDMEERFPEIVARDESGLLSVAYGRLAALLLGAVSEQQTAFEMQDAQLKAQSHQLSERDAEIDALRDRVASLEDRLLRLESNLKR